MREAIRLHEITMSIPGKTVALTAFELTETAGEHARGTATVILKDEEKHKLIDDLYFGSTVDIRRGYETLFAGTVERVRVTHRDGVYTAKLWLISYSFKLDVEKVNRSFQHTEQNVEELVKALATARGGHLYYALGGSETLERPMLQYQETDWQFIKRLASYLRVPIWGDARSYTPRLFFGVPLGDVYEIESPEFRMVKDLSTYLEADAVNGDWEEEQCAVFHMETTEHYQLGDKITLNGIALIVAAKKIKLTQGVIMFEYGLQRELGVRPNAAYNPAVSGVTLTGKVLAVAGDKVRLHLNIDKQQDAEKAYWYPMGPSYTADGSTGIYMMPQAGDTALLHFPDDKEWNAYIKGIYRTDGKENEKTQDPSTKYFENNYGKEMRMSPSDYTFTASSGAVEISMSDDGGISITGESGVSISGSYIGINGYDITIDGQDQVTFVTSGSNMVVDEEVNIWGDGGVSY